MKNITKLCFTEIIKTQEDQNVWCYSMKKSQRLVPNKDYTENIFFLKNPVIVIYYNKTPCTILLLLILFLRPSNFSEKKCRWKFRNWVFNKILVGKLIIFILCFLKKSFITDINTFRRTLFFCKRKSSKFIII